MPNELNVSQKKTVLHFKCCSKIDLSSRGNPSASCITAHSYVTLIIKVKLCLTYCHLSIYMFLTITKLALKQALTDF